MMKNNSEELLESLGETVEYARLYIQQQGDYVRLEAAERLSKVTSSLATVMVIGFIAFMVLVMFSIAAGFWLGEMMDSYSAAFLVVGLAYAVLAGIIYVFRRSMITNPALNMILDSFFNRDDDNKPDDEHINIPPVEKHSAPTNGTRAAVPPTMRMKDRPPVNPVL